MAGDEGGTDRRRHPLQKAFAIVVAGVISGFIAIVLSIGHGSLLFTGDLQIYLPVSIGMALFSTIFLTATAAFGGMAKGVVPITQEIPVVALATVATAVAAAMPETTAGPARLATLIAAVALGTALTGLFAFLLGVFRLGGIIRYVPYPVIGGFLAGTGWLILSGGVSLVTGKPVTPGLLGDLSDPSMLARLGLTGLFVVGLVVVQLLSRSALALPVLILVVLLVFNGVVGILDVSYGDLRADGWLIQLPASGHLWPPIGIADLALVDWWAVVSGLLSLPAVVVLTTIAFLMNATGIELESHEDMNLDRELRSIGAVNIFAAVGAGLPGYHTVSLTLLARRLGGESRWIGVIIAGLTLAAIVFGGILLDAVPALVLGGVLMWVGGGLMVEWLIVAYRRLHIAEYLIIVLIFVTIVGISFAMGILVGLIAAVVLFAFEYGRIDVVRHELAGSDYRIDADTTAGRGTLTVQGDATIVMKLQGFLFFGTADRLRRRAQERIAASKDGKLKFLVMDFQRVSGLDSSAALSFTRLARHAERHGVGIVLTGMTVRARRIFSHANPDGIGINVKADLEHGLKWCEDFLLAPPALVDGNAVPPTLGHLLTDLTGDGATAALIAPHWERVEIPAGGTVIEQGSPSDDIFLIESGSATVAMHPPGQEPIRLADVGAGAVIGELAFYLHEARSASIVAGVPVVVWRFTRDGLAALNREAPAAAGAFHESVARMLARRLTRTNRLVRLLAD